MRYFRYLLIAGASLWSLPVFAADLTPPPEPASEWTFAFAPYFWAAGIQGDVGVGNLPTVEIDASFSDIFKNLDFGAMAIGEARNDRFGIVTDFMYVKLSAQRGVNLHNHDLNVDVEVTNETLTGLLAGEYRIVEAEGGSLDLMAGARLWSVRNEIDISGDINRSGDDKTTWVDPMVGFKGRLNLSSDFFVDGWGMIGGFDVSSKFAWDAYGGLGYMVSDSTSLIAGYRGLGVDFENSDLKFDVIEHGPLLGAVFTF